MPEQRISGKCLKTELNSILKEYKLTQKAKEKWSSIKTEADLYSEKQKKDLAKLNKWSSMKTDSDLYRNKLQIGGLIELNLPDLKLKYKDNYVPIINARYIEDKKSWELIIKDLTDGFITINIQNDETYEINYDKNISCNPDDEVEDLSLPDFGGKIRNKSKRSKRSKKGKSRMSRRITKTRRR